MFGAMLQKNIAHDLSLIVFGSGFMPVDFTRICHYNFIITQGSVRFA